MKVREQILYVLSQTGYTATKQNMQRAYWRFAKLRGGINGHPKKVGFDLAQYLLQNGLVTELI